MSSIKTNGKLLKKTSKFIYGYSFKLGINKRIKIESNYLKLDDRTLIKINAENNSLSSEIPSINEFVTKITDIKPNYNCLKLNVNIPPLLVDRLFITQLFNCPLDIISEFFQSNNISYVSPLRAYPQRYYLLDDSNVYSKFNSMSGKELAEILKQRKVNQINDEYNSKINEINKEYNWDTLKNIGGGALMIGASAVPFGGFLMIPTMSHPMAGIMECAIGMVIILVNYLILKI